MARQVDGLDRSALFEVLRSGSASSFALEAMNRAITVDNASHLTKLQLLDMELFAAAFADFGVEEVTARAVAGSRGLGELACVFASPDGRAS